MTHLETRILGSFHIAIFRRECSLLLQSLSYILDVLHRDGVNYTILSKGVPQNSMTSVITDRPVAEDSPIVGDPDRGVQALQEDDEDDNGVTEIESLCMNCHDNVKANNTPRPRSSLIHFAGNHKTQDPPYPLLPRSPP